MKRTHLKTNKEKKRYKKKLNRKNFRARQNLQLNGIKNHICSSLVEETCVGKLALKSGEILYSRIIGVDNMLG